MVVLKHELATAQEKNKKDKAQIAKLELKISKARKQLD